MKVIIETPEDALAAADALAAWGRARADQTFERLDALEWQMVGAIMAQVTDPDYAAAFQVERDGSGSVMGGGLPQGE